ncbi:hypothetical protein LTS18_003071 [Coniosporium uncinatum]|uniref:Uncharacterized protein n=1 Tax=Coniosporium uncinatum TaxID=93489 RepID=A0ACC3DYS6_9PEZI|nr:hypothetical protein LTS18_003071 [Coniosporium uncinatum]
MTSERSSRLYPHYSFPTPETNTGSPTSPAFNTPTNITYIGGIPAAQEEQKRPTRAPTPEYEIINMDIVRKANARRSNNDNNNNNNKRKSSGRQTISTNETTASTYETGSESEDIQLIRQKSTTKSSRRKATSLSPPPKSTSTKRKATDKDTPSSSSKAKKSRRNAADTDDDDDNTPPSKTKSSRRRSAQEDTDEEYTRSDRPAAPTIAGQGPLADGKGNDLMAPILQLQAEHAKLKKTAADDHRRVKYYRAKSNEFEAAVDRYRVECQAIEASRDLWQAKFEARERRLKELEKVVEGLEEGEVREMRKLKGKVEEFREEKKSLAGMFEEKMREEYLRGVKEGTEAGEAARTIQGFMGGAADAGAGGGGGERSVPTPASTPNIPSEDALEQAAERGRDEMGTQLAAVMEEKEKELRAAKEETKVLKARLQRANEKATQGLSIGTPSQGSRQNSSAAHGCVGDCDALKLAAEKVADTCGVFTGASFGPAGEAISKLVAIVRK